MSIITFINKDMKESGQTLSVAAIAAFLAIEHNYRILLISTDFKDKTLEDCFFNEESKGLNVKGLFTKSLNANISNGLEGLIRMFASNRADPETIMSYTKPILKDRLDILQSPKTVDYKEYANMSIYFSQIADVANTKYDLVIVDLSNKIPEESQRKVMNISSLTILSINQNRKSMVDFERVKMEDETFRRKNVLLAVGKYNPNSKYTAKNIGRYLKEKNIPVVIPYNILFSDYCSEGKVIDYFLQMSGINLDDKNGYFCSQVKKSAERIDYLRQAQDYGLNG